MISKQTFDQKMLEAKRSIFNFFYNEADKSLDFDFSFLEQFIGQLVVYNLENETPNKTFLSSLEKKLTFYTKLNPVFYLNHFQVKIPYFFSSSFLFGFSTHSANQFLKKRKKSKLRFTRIFLSEPIQIEFDNNLIFEKELKLKEILGLNFSKDFLNKVEDIADLDISKYLIWRMLSFKKLGKGYRHNLRGKKIIFPRPFDLNSLNFKSIATNYDLTVLGHNGAYEEIFFNELTEIRPFIFWEYLNENDRLSLSEKNEYPKSLKKKKTKNVLINLFPFGLFGYPEYECNDFYQKYVIFDILEFLNDIKDINILVSPHPSTKDLKYIDNIFASFPKFKKTTYDESIGSVDTVINTYRSTSTLVESIKLMKNTILILSSNPKKIEEFEDLLDVVNINDLSWKKKLRTLL